MPHQTNTSNPVDFPTSCAHCSNPQYAGIRCGVCGRWTDEKLDLIQQLTQQATTVFEPDDPDYRQVVFNTRKFAELIVKECVKEIEFQFGGGSDQPMDNEWDRAIECVSSMVKHRFGIEE